MTKRKDMWSNIRLIQFFTLIGIVLIIAYQFNLNFGLNVFELLLIFILAGVIIFIVTNVVKLSTTGRLTKKSSKA